jgi:hypothetical protein
MMASTLSAVRLTVEESALAQAYWCSSRLVNHGWRLHELGCDDYGGYFTAETPDGRAVTVREDTEPAMSLQSQLCATLSRLARKADRDGADYLRYLSVMLRVHRPAHRLSAEQLRPWPIPGHSTASQPSEAVRLAYWLTSILVDDYGWQITNLDRRGFTAVTPGQPSPVRYRSTARHNGTTGAELAHRLAALTAPEVQILGELVRDHLARGGGDRR